MSKVSRNTERYEKVPIFGHLTQAEIGRVLRSTEELQVPAGTVIFKAGDTCDGFYILLSGRVEIRKPDQNGTEVPVAILSTRSVFGEMSLIVDRPDRKRSATAVATEPTHLNKVAKEAFDALLAAGDLCAYKIIHSFAKIITERLKRTEDELLAVLKEISGDKREKKLAELQAFRQKLFSEWSF
ncbi:cyclic nucleotide-binding domain-containing protein [bacterium]|nr:cyclic nucleotide-binding domain-containing protein [bacterium]